MPLGVEPFSRRRERDVLTFLSRAPYDNAFLTWVVEGQRSTSAREALYIHTDAGGSVTGVGYFGRQVVLAATDVRVAVAFAERRYGRERMIVAPRLLVETYWKRVRGWHGPPRLIRESQPLLAVDASQITASALEGMEVRPARGDEWESIAFQSAKMIEGELGYDPLGAGAAEFFANVRGMIARELWWVGEYRGKLCFACNRGPQTSATLQLQGIWTPPEMRGRGLATAAMGAICRTFLQRVPTLSLYVNGFNEPALALYRRLGFRPVGEFQTLLF